MLASFGAGVLAGLAIALPVGAIAVLIVDLGIRRGFAAAAAAGAGAASADGAYAALAALGGAALAGLLDPLERPLRLVAIVALLWIGGRGIARLFGDRRAAAREAGAPPSGRGTYVRFLGLTLLNPATVIYFAALILAVPDLGHGPAERSAFVAGAFLASLAWQTTLAAIGAVAHHRMPPRFQVAISVLGNLVICGFAVSLATRL